MKKAHLVTSLQVFCLFVHAFLIVTLVAIGFFDYLGIEAQATSSAELVTKLAARMSQVGEADSLTLRIADGTVEVSRELLSLLRGLSLAAILSFSGHVISFLVKRKQDSGGF